MKRNKLIKSAGITLAAVLTLASFTGCSKTDTNTSSAPKVLQTLKVGVCAGPYGDMFKDAIQPSLEDLGYSVEYVEFSDYVQPNNALAEKEIDLNMFQHSTYLKKFATEHSLDLTNVTEIPTAAMGIFSSKFDNIDSIAAGSVVAIPNDDTNLSRAIRVLAQTGIITINPAINAATAKPADITSNPKNLTFTEVSAEILPTVLDSVGLAIINGNYAISAGLKLSDAVYNEKLAEGYFNIIAVRTENAESQYTKDIYSIVHSDKFRSVIEDESKQYAAFGRPSGYAN